MANQYLNIPVPTPTQDPVPSAKIQDHVFAGAKLDEWATSNENTYIDRLGGEKLTSTGMANRASLLGKPYASMELAQEDIINGKIHDNDVFSVVSVIYGSAIDLFKNEAGQPVYLTSVSNAESVNKVISQLPIIPGELVSGRPLFGVESEDGDDDIVAWLDDDYGLDSLRLGKNLKADMTNSLVEGGQVLATLPSLDDPLIYPIHSVGDDVDFYMDNGCGVLYDIKLTSPTALNIDKAKATQPLVTSGKNLFRWRSKIAKLNAGVLARAKILITGDSWAEFVTIPERYSAWLYGAYQKSADGWISVQGDFYLNGTTLTKSGWTFYDASINTTAPTYGCAMDGMAITATSTTATVNVTGLTATDISIYYRDGNGTFRYSIDGGTPVVVTGGGTNITTSIKISGLANSTHNVTIDTVGNAGNVTIYGFYGESPSVNGIEIVKAGNAGARGLDYQTEISTYISKYGSEINPDLVIVILGTNDYRGAGITVDSFIGGIDAIVQGYRTPHPDVGIVFVCPAQSKGVPNPNPLSTFISAATDYCMSNNVEFVDLFSAFPSYDEANSLGLWIDTLHLNSVGAQFLVDLTKEKIL
ncbi:SGNH/GDSL hydrolase family protein [Serratia inhibens]